MPLHFRSEIRLDCVVVIIDPRIPAISLPTGFTRLYLQWHDQTLYIYRYFFTMWNMQLLSSAVKYFNYQHYLRAYRRFAEMHIHLKATPIESILVKSKSIKNDVLVAVTCRLATWCPGNLRYMLRSQLAAMILPISQRIWAVRYVVGSHSVHAT